MNTPSSDKVPVLDEQTLQLLQGLLAGAAFGAAESRAAAGLRGRLLDRVQRSAAAAAAFHTVRGAALWRGIGAGAREQLLYRRDVAHSARRGEPLRVRRVMLAATARCEMTDVAPHTRCEWLLIAGEARVDEEPLRRLDYHVTHRVRGPRLRAGASGACLFLREAAQDLQPIERDPAPHTARDAACAWHAYAPGIERRVLWRSGREAALLYRVLPGAAVPGHHHGHDEECLMLEGDAFIDDVLLRQGEYQLAPAGTRHSGVSSDTGGLIYAHGDVELEFV